MKKYSKTQLAQAYLALAKNAPRKAISALAAALVTQKKTHEIDFIVREIGRLLSQRGTVVASVRTAHELSPNIRREVAELVKNFSRAAELDVDYRVDPDLLGGFVISLPAQEIDSSLASVLKKL